MANKKVVKKTTTKNKTNKETKKVEVKKETKKVVEKKVEKKETKETKKDLGILFAIIGIVAVIAAAVVCFVIPANESSNESDKVLAVMTIKDYGDIMLELDRTQAPKTVDNFLELANSGFYDGLSFQRIIKGFMMQGGDPDGDGYGGSGKSVKGEFEANGVKNNISHVRGTISMARGDDPDSASSQFFIVQEDSTNLDGYYAAFGKVTSGMDIVDKIINDFGTEDDETLPTNKRPIIVSIREVEVAEIEGEE
jgi:cyclophilin family peptidyl-prolyl cis-trans isomerase